MIIRPTIISILLTFMLFCTGWAEYPYTISRNKDLPLLIGGAMTFGLGQWQLSEMEPWQGEVEYNFPWDRPFRGQYDTQAEMMSNITTTLFLAPLYLSYRNHKTEWAKSDEIVTEAIMLTEVILINSGLNLFTRSFKAWPRPYMHSGEISDAERTNHSASGSFYSGHAANSFAIASFLTTTFNAKYPNHHHTKWMALSSFGVATAVSYYRVKAGKHYPTDVVVGALVGTFIGWCIPYIHTRDDISLKVDHTGGEIAVNF